VTDLIAHERQLIPRPTNPKRSEVRTGGDNAMRVLSVESIATQNRFLFYCLTERSGRRLARGNNFHFVVLQ
jgi:hypothetical protein